MNDYLQEIKTLICDKTGADPSEVEEGSHFEVDLNIPELELIELLTELEEKHEIELIDELENIQTIQDLADLMVEKI